MSCGRLRHRPILRCRPPAPAPRRARRRRDLRRHRRADHGVPRRRSCGSASRRIFQDTQTKTEQPGQPRSAPERWPPPGAGDATSGARGWSARSPAVLVFLVFLLFAVQLLFNLYATSAVTAAGLDAARVRRGPAGRPLERGRGPGGQAGGRGPSPIGARPLRPSRSRSAGVVDGESVQLRLHVTNPRVFFGAPGPDPRLRHHRPHGPGAGGAVPVTRPIATADQGSFGHHGAAKGDRSAASRSCRSACSSSSSARCCSPTPGR